MSDDVVVGASFDVSEVHRLLDEANEKFHAVLDGHVPGHVDRFTPHLNTCHMLADLAAVEATKE
jgi:hypothetical protein